MLNVSPKLDKYDIIAGEPWIMSVQFRDSETNDALDVGDRRWVLSFFRNSGRGLFDEIDGVPAGAGILQFIRPGVFTESLFGQGLKVSLSERFLLGRETLATGPLKIADSADPVVSFGSLIGRAEIRATVYLDKIGQIVKWGDLLRLAYATDGNPVIYTPAAVQSDGTPQAGETLAGVDPVGNGPVVARRWVLDGATVSTDQTYTPTAGGSYRFEADLQGPNGGIATSFSTITVAGATLNNTLDTTQLRGMDIAGFPEIVAELDALLIGKAR